MNLLEEIKETEIPGKGGGGFFYAQVVYGHFDAIEKLKVEGFTLTTICRFLEKKGALPPNADPHSFRRAFRREIARRQRVISKEVKVNDTAKKRMESKENISKHEILEASMKQNLEAPIITTKPKNSKARPQINPDNTFRIAPIDPDDLPDIR